jgi:hypothetical protein
VTTKQRLIAISRFLLFAVAAALVLFGVNIALGKFPSTAHLLQQTQSGTLTVALVLIVDGIGLLAVLLLSWTAVKLEHGSFSSTGLPLRNPFPAKFWQGIVWGLILATSDMLITRLLGGFRFGGFALSAADAIKYILLWAFAFTVVGLFEEILFRGYPLHALSAGIGFWPAAVILSALFGGLHLFNPGETAIGAIDVFIYGLFACLTLRRTGNLWFAIGIHAAWNFSLTILYSVPGSGMQATGHLLHSTLQGPTWLTGGPDGPEGSVIGLAVLLADFLLFPRFFSRSLEAART